MNLLQRALGRHSIATVDDLVEFFSFNGTQYPLGVNQTSPGRPVEQISHSFTAYSEQIYKRSPIAFAAIKKRRQVFSQARLVWQHMNDGKPGELHTTSALNILDRPGPGLTQSDLLAEMIDHADLGGQWYGVVIDGEVVSLRPDWVDIVLAPRIVHDAQVGWRRLGCTFYQDGLRTGSGVTFPASQVAHFAPLRDPIATYRGMSWLTPVLRDLGIDSAFTEFKRDYLANGATPNMLIHGIRAASEEQFAEIVDKLKGAHDGPGNAGRTLYLGEGADATVVGSDLKALDVSAVQGQIEARISVGSGVPAVMLGISEGLRGGSALSQGNYRQSARQWSDTELFPLLGNAAGSISGPIVTPPPASRLWFDPDGVPFLQEDRADEADIQAKKASAIRQLVDGGWEPDTVRDAVEANDYSMLVHSGNLSVQLTPDERARRAALDTTERPSMPGLRSTDEVVSMIRHADDVARLETEISRLRRGRRLEIVADEHGLPVGVQETTA